MSLLALFGFENDNAADWESTAPGVWVGWDGQGITGLVAGRKGGYALEMRYGLDNVAFPLCDTAGADIDGCVVGFGWKWTGTQFVSGATGNGEFYEIYHDGTRKFWLETETNGQISVYDSTGTRLGQTSVLIYPQRWHYIECYVDSATGTVKIAVDGCPAGTFTGTFDTGFDECRWTHPSAGIASGNVDLDDGYIADLVDDGTIWNDFVGDIQNVPLWPNADASVAFTPLSGTNVSNINQGQSGEGPDGDTSYNEDSVVGDEDLFGVASLGLEATQEVLGLCILGQVRKTTIGDRKVQLQYQGSGAVRDGVAQPVSENYRYFLEPIGGDPDAAFAAWSPAAIDAVKLGYKIES